MCFFKKKTKEDGLTIIEDRELLLLSSQEMDVLIAMSHDEELKDKLLDIKEQLKYLSPYDNPKVTNIDKRIKQKIEDIKLILVKEDHINLDFVSKEIDLINIWIKERNAKELR